MPMRWQRACLLGSRMPEGSGCCPGGGATASPAAASMILRARGNRPPSLATSLPTRAGPDRRGPVSSAGRDGADAPGSPRTGRPRACAEAELETSCGDMRGLKYGRRAQAPKAALGWGRWAGGTRLQPLGAGWNAVARLPGGRVVLACRHAGGGLFPHGNSAKPKFCPGHCPTTPPEGRKRWKGADIFPAARVGVPAAPANAAAATPPHRGPNKLAEMRSWRGKLRTYEQRGPQHRRAQCDRGVKRKHTARLTPAACNDKKAHRTQSLVVPTPW